MAMCVYGGECKPHGRAWLMGLPIRKHQRMPWHGHKGNEHLHGRAWAMEWPIRKSRSMPWHGHGWLPMKGPWNSLAHVIDNQKGTCQCHGMAMGLSKEGPNGRGWPMALPFRTHQAKPWQGQVCVWGWAMQAPGKSLAHGMANQKAPGNPMAWPLVVPIQDQWKSLAHVMANQKAPKNAMAWARAMSISMEELGPWDDQSESPDQCHGMAMGGCQ